MGSRVLEWVASSFQFSSQPGDGDGPSVGAEASGAQVQALEAGSSIRPSPGLLFSPPAGSPGQKRGPRSPARHAQGIRHNDPPC